MKGIRSFAQTSKDVLFYIFVRFFMIVFVKAAGQFFLPDHKLREYNGR